MQSAQPVENLKLESGWLCLDFANTVEWHLSNHPTERLTSYNEFVTWAHAIGLLPDSTAQQLLHAADQYPRQAAHVLERAVGVREAVYRIFSAVAAGKAPAVADQATLNAELHRTLTKSYLVWNNASFEWDRQGAEGDLDQILWRILRSTTELLTSEELKRVGVCADDRGCGWLFYDTSRNRTRQWCSMRGCGNRAKARRHYEKVKSD
jgi:predicted RNA-binding Zn ribbon-like protein